MHFLSLLTFQLSADALGIRKRFTDCNFQHFLSDLQISNGRQHEWEYIFSIKEQLFGHNAKFSLQHQRPCGILDEQLTLPAGHWQAGRTDPWTQTRTRTRMRTRTGTRIRVWTHVQWHFTALSLASVCLSVDVGLQTLINKRDTSCRVPGGMSWGSWSNVLGVAVHLFVCKILIEIYIFKPVCARQSASPALLQL